MTSPSQPVPPLRIQKGATGSPVKNAIPRPLSEIAPTEKRRNSPSYNHATKKMLLNGDSSPFQSSSPFNASAEGSSPRLFWQGRDPASSKRFSTENLAGARDSSLSPTRRSSIERLQKASRVKNSNMFAREQKQEYDPTAMPVLERPLAKHLQGNAYGGKGLEGFRSSDNIRPATQKRSDSKNSISLGTTPVLSPPTESSRPSAGNRSPSRDRISPTKSSMASSRYNGKALYDPEHNSWEEENSGDERELPPGRALHRHAKSVTFDAAPPQINEYEMATPDISSIGTGSRENSYDSAEDDDDDSYLHGDSLDHDDSFDASLEDTDKTPVVGPDDWRHSGESSNYGMVSGYYDDPFDGPDGSSLPDARPSSSGRAGNSLNDSLGSNGEHRPLPPLPGMAGHSRNGSVSSSTPGAEGRATSPRNLPTPPPASISKTDLQLMNGSKLTLEERLQLMMIQDDETPKTAAEQQRERRMRRAGARNSHTPEHNAQQISIHEDEDTLDDLPGLDSYKLPPRISRESILRKVKGQEPFTRESDYNLSSPMGSSPERPSTSDLANIDPDTPIPTTESAHDDDEDDDDEGSVIVKSEMEDDDDEGSVIVKSEMEDDDADIYSVSEIYHPESRTDSYPDEETDGPTDDDDETEDDDEESHYSDDMPPHESPQFQSNSVPEDDGPPTPRNISPASLTMPAEKGERRISLPEFAGLMNETDFGLSLKSYMTPSPPPEKLPEQRSASSLSEAHEYLAASETPEAVEQPSASSSTATEKMPEPLAESVPEPLPEHATEEAPKEVMEEKAPEEISEPQEERAPSTENRSMLPRPEYDGSEWGPQEDEEEEEESDAGSVIHHPLISPTPPPPSDSPGIPEQVATIKASSGSKLKTRPSVTPSDLAAMREARRQVSGTGPVVPPIPQRHRNRPSLGGEQDEEDDTVGYTLQRHPSFKKRSLTLDIGGDLGLSLESDFDRVIEAQKVAFDLSFSHSTFINNGSGQASEDSNNLSNHANQSPRQRGYLMRQNTKVVVASSDHTDEPREAKSAGNSPTKADRPQSWVVEPWNGNRKSSRSRPGSPRKKPPTGAIPPMPGHESNATGLGILPEGQATEPTPDEGAERGRLFVKVIGVKDLDLPLPKNERSWFSLTLDNGVHCVTTAWLELGKNAPIGQEFELVVPNELEFQLTLNAKLEKPAPKRVQTAPVKPQKTSKPSTFSRVFASPKKRKELEMRHKEEEQRIAQQKQQDAQAAKSATEQTAWDLLSPLAAADGSFGRSYVCLKDHETRCFGRPYNVDVACFNEWATEEIQSSSVMSKRSATQVRKRAPYAVGKLQLQLLFVPKPKGASDDDMPKSMNACIREMKEAELEVARQFEGHLSQQGGDCPYWRRRFFRLSGSKLTAYHESTRQPRVTINLANAHKLIDDRRALTQKETTGKAGRRRKSGFAEDEEGYMFVEEGFRIRFNNGEVIDFYADSPADKEAWMSVLDACVGKEREGGKGGWCELVLKREEQMLRKASGTSGKGRGHSRIKSTIF